METQKKELSMVPLEDETEACFAVSPEDEDGAEGRFMQKWMRLSASQRLLVDQAERMGSTSGGVSLGLLAVAMGERRGRVEAQLGEALSVLMVEDV